MLEMRIRFSKHPFPHTYRSVDWDAITFVENNYKKPGERSDFAHYCSNSGKLDVVVQTFESSDLIERHFPLCVALHRYEQ